MRLLGLNFTRLTHWSQLLYFDALAHTLQTLYLILMKYSHPLYTVQVSQEKKQLTLSMQVDPRILYTSAFPEIQSFLQTNAPRVLRTKCFNPQKFTFAKEVLDTEMAHFFEHVLIQNLCEECISSGKTSACFRADTEWDWTKNPRGSFTITIHSPVEEKWLQPALEKTIQLTDKLVTQIH